MLLPFLWQCFKSIKLIVEKYAGCCAFETQSGSLAFEGTLLFWDDVVHYPQAGLADGIEYSYRLKTT